MGSRLRQLKPDLDPTGRTIRVRQLVEGDPCRSRLVPVRLGGRHDKRDYVEGFCLAQKKGGGQCGRRPRKGYPTCGQHGAGHRTRHERQARLSAEEAGALSGVARRITRDGGPDLRVQFVEALPLFQGRLRALRADNRAASLDEEILALTALRDSLVAGEIEQADPSEFIKALTGIIGAKAQAVFARHAIERRLAIPVPTMRRYVRVFVDLMQRYVPAERQGAMLAALRVLARRASRGTDPSKVS